MLDSAYSEAIQVTKEIRRVAGESGAGTCGCGKVREESSGGMKDRATARAREGQ
jgi:hypothetical protein